MEKKKDIFYKVNKLYSLTINFNDNHQFPRIDNPFRKASKLSELIHEYIDDEDVRYLLHFDISEPREMKLGTYPRIHLHGCIKFKTTNGIRNWLLKSCRLLSQIAYMQIDTIGENVDIWQQYCSKYDHITNFMPIRSRMAWGDKKMINKKLIQN